MHVLTAEGNSRTLVDPKWTRGILRKKGDRKARTLQKDGGGADYVVTGVMLGFTPAKWNYFLTNFSQNAYYSLPALFLP